MKLENIFLTKEMVPKIADFGLMKSSEGKMVTLCGTPNHMAPELLTEPHKKYEGAAVDVFACGHILFMMLTQKPCFSRSDDQHYAAFEKDPITYLKSRKIQVSEGSLNLIWNMCARDPKKRPSLHAIKNHDWFKQEMGTA